MDFALSEEQLMLQSTFRDFAQNEVKPVAREIEKNTDPSTCYSMDLIKKASALGIRTACLPTEYGGSGLGLQTMTIIFEELSAGDMGFAFSVYHTVPFCMGGLLVSSEELKDEFLQKFLEDDTFLFAYGMSEPHGMTEAILPYEPGGFKTFAEKKGDSYVINGAKMYCSNAPLAKLIAVNARTNMEGPLTENWSVFLVPVDTPGLTIGKVHDHMGMRMLMTAELFLENVTIPARYLIGGKEGLGYVAGERHFAPLVVTIKATNLLGVLRELYDASVSYARERVVCGKPIIEHPTIKLMLADMRVKIEAARLLIRKTAWSVEKHPEDVKNKNEMAYLTLAYVKEIAVTIMRDADEIHGGTGTNKEMITEKLIRDAFTILHGMTSRSIGYLKGAPTLE